MPFDNGPILRVRRIGPGNMPMLSREHTEYAPHAVDILVRNKNGTAIDGYGAAGGCAWCEFDWADWLSGRIPDTQLAAANSYAIGCVAPDQAEAIADGAEYWLRVAGFHPYAAMDGTSAVSVNSYVGIVGTAGVAIVQTNEGLSMAQSLDAYSTAAPAPKRVWILNRGGIATL
jgi:hypothetical protein